MTQTGPGHTIAQVVPAVPTFSVDDGFSYAIPGDMELSVGSIVRVPLGGRRVRGYVTGLRTGDAATLKSVIRSSSPVPVFDAQILETLRAIAVHYVAPLAVVLAKSAPPNLPGTPRPRRLPPIPDPPDTPLPELTARLAGHRHGRPHYLLGRRPWEDAVTGLAAPLLAAGRSVVVVMPTVAEMEALGGALDGRFPGRLLQAASVHDAKAVTAAWSRAARHPGHIVVGTREVAFWPIADLGLAIVLGEGRKGMKEKSSPTIHAREVVRRRAAVERFGLVLAGPVPTTEVIASGIPVVRRDQTRSWPLVEVVDRNEEPPGSGFLATRTMAALRAVADAGGRAFVFTHRRGYAPAFRCTQCRLVRACTQCEARADKAPVCARCGTELGPCVACGARSFEPLGAGVERIAEQLARSLPVGMVGSDQGVWVGTERDLPAVADVDLAVVVDADGLVHAPNYRAAEDALRLMARVAETVGSGSSRRAIVQTARPDDPVVAALRRGDPEEFLAETIRERAATRLPPGGEVLVIELDGTGAADGEIRQLAADRAEVFGPAEHSGRHRWLVQGRDLRAVRIGLRRLVQSWRDAGRRVRVDVDPLEL
jgi:primosomal protein N' (replication factor Y)